MRYNAVQKTLREIEIRCTSCGDNRDCNRNYCCMTVIYDVDIQIPLQRDTPIKCD
jgi:hypothetical protein